jgi:uncharacterized protein (TIGR00251 family)
LKLPYRKTDGGILINIKVEPRSSRAGIQGAMGDSIKVKLTSAPVDGEANRQLVELIAKEFGIRKSAVKIVKGFNSKHKIVKLLGRDSL